MALHKLATYISTLLPLNYRWNNRASVARSQNRFPSRPLCCVLRQIAQPNVKHRPFGIRYTTFCYLGFETLLKSYSLYNWSRFQRRQILYAITTIFFVRKWTHRKIDPWCILLIYNLSLKLVICNLSFLFVLSFAKFLLYHNIVCEFYQDIDDTLQIDLIGIYYIIL